MRTRSMLFSSHIQDLPWRVLNKIFEYLDLKSLYALAQTDNDLRDSANRFLKWKSKSDWRRDFLLESGHSRLAVEKALASALNRKRKFTQTYKSIPALEYSDHWNDDLGITVLTQENFLIYQSQLRCGTTAPVVKNRKSGVETSIQSGSICITEKSIALLCTEKTEVHIWKIDENETQHLIRKLPSADLKNPLKCFKIRGNFFVVEHNHAKISLFDIESEIPKKIDLPDWEQYLSDSEKLGRTLPPQCFIDEQNDFLIERIEIGLKVIDLVFHVRTEKYEILSLGSE